MFEKKDFISHAGLHLTWKIECDDLTDADIETLAFMVSEHIEFKEVFGIPRGGVRFANALQKYVVSQETQTHKQFCERLVVDDVFTTGRSMQDVLKDGDVGLVIFSRNPLISKNLDIQSMFDCHF